MKKLFVISALVLSLGATSCTTRAVVTTRPEAAVVVRPAQPRPEYVWVSGDWVWTGGRYTWREGYWAPPRAGHVWVEGRWTQRKSGWYWERGHWK